MKHSYYYLILASAILLPACKFSEPATEPAAKPEQKKQVAAPKADQAAEFRKAVNNINALVRQRDFAQALNQCSTVIKTAVNDDQKAEILRIRINIGKTIKDEALLKQTCDETLKLTGNINTKKDALSAWAWHLRGVKKIEECRAAWKAFGALLPDDHEHQVNTKLNIADTYWSRNFSAIQEKLLLEVIHDDKASTSARFNAKNNLFNKLYFAHKGKAPLALPVLKKMKTIPDLTFQQKLELTGNEANLLLEMEKIDEAIDLYEKFIAAQQDITPVQKAQVIFATGNFMRNCARPDLAVKYYEQYLIADAEKNVGKYYTCARFLVECYASENQAAKGVDLAEKYLVTTKTFNSDDAKFQRYHDVIGLALQTGQAKKAIALAEAALKLTGLTERKQQEGKYNLFRAVFAANDLERASKLVDAEIAAKNPLFNNAALQLGTRYFERRQLAKAVKYFDHVPAGIFNGGSWMDRDKAVTVLKPYAILGNNKALAEKAESFAAHKRFEPRYRAQFAMIAALAKNPKADLKAAVREMDLKNDEAVASVMAEAGKFYVSTTRNDLAEYIYAQRSKLFKPEKRNELVIRYVKNAPTDVGSWLNSDIIKDPKNRAEVKRIYGAKEAANLVTDVMAAGRNVGDSSVQADKETYFYACYDEYGVHIYFVGVDSKVKDVMAGKIGGSGYEMNLALSEKGPSYQWLFDQPKDNLYSPPWNSPHEFYRHLKDYVTISSRPVENGIATAMTFSWALAYHMLPDNGTTWPFELIRWTRGGGVTWGGKSVWQFGNWGRLKFAGMTPEVKREIQRIIIHKAYSRYKAQRSAHGGGKIAVWQDAELGDPEFYRKALKAEVDRLDGLGKLITDDMSDATIEKLYIEGVPGWFDFVYKAAAIRTDYLMDRFIETGK